jgi:hypothetical protein
MRKKKKSEKELRYKEIRPFGPTILKFTIPNDVINNLNRYVDNLDEEGESGIDHSSFLAGKVKQELAIPDDILMMSSEFFFKACNEYVEHYDRLTRSIHSDHHINGIYDKLTQEFIYSIESAWYVRSFSGDYNPVHMHPSGRLSCTGYLKLPEWEDEQSSDSEDHFGLTHGCLQFINSAGGSHEFVRSSYTVKPKVGDLYVFPGWLSHCVYPFTTDGERRSLSMNFSVIKAHKR